MCHGGKKTDREMSLLVDQMGKNDFPDLAKQINIGRNARKTGISLAK